jgi:hypothetical protein
VPEARVWHRIPGSRMRPEYFEQWAWMASASDMFELWRGRPRSFRTLCDDLRRIVRSYWKCWVHAAHTPRRPDARAVRIRSRARRGLYELVYLWWIISRPDLRELLDAESFGP